MENGELTPITNLAGHESERKNRERLARKSSPSPFLFRRSRKAGGSMKCLSGIIVLLISILIMGTSMNAFGFLGFGGTSWKEEVLLHDGRTIIVKRSQTYGGRHEIGQAPPVREHTISFTVPSSNNVISWKSEYSDDIGRTNFNLLALHILNGIPYLVVEPNLCLSYNKWGRPNPPYVFFKHDGTAWKRIVLSELPAEFITINLIVNNSRLEDIKKLADRTGYVPAEGVRQINSSLRQPEYKTILRELLDSKKIACKEMIRSEDAWFGIDWFSSQPNYEACLKMCERQKVSPQNCPCGRIFNEKSEGK